MILKLNPDHPLRIYLEDDSPGEMHRLRLSLDNKYSPPEDNQFNREEELDSLIFYDTKIDQYYIVRGLVNIIIRECNSLGIPCHSEIEDDDTDIVYPEVSADILEGITLREYQLRGIELGLAYKRGIIQVGTGGGKTEMLASIVRYFLDNSDMNILVCVPTTNLLYQTQDRLLSRGIPEFEISLLGDGNSIDKSRRVAIAIVASAFKRLDSDPDYMEWVSNVDCLMMDEAHHSKCRTWSTVIDKVAPEYLLGFTAEPFHRDKNHMISDLILRGLLGPVIHRVTMEDLVALGYLSKPYVLAVDSRFKGNMLKVVEWKTVNKNCIVQNTLRNNSIRDIAITLINSNKRPLILVQQIAHGKQIAELISSQGYSVYMMQGGRKISTYSDGMNIDNYIDNDNVVLKDFNEGKIDALIGTSTLDEGADIPTLSSVILAGGGKGRLKTIQKIGRAMRKKEGLNCTFIIDFRDRFNVVTHSHFKKRKTLYDDMNIGVYYIQDNVESLSNAIASLELERSNELRVTSESDTSL